MATQYNIYSYLKGVNGFGLPVCDTSYSAALTKDTDTTVTVPQAGAQGALNPTYGPNKYLALIVTNDNETYLAINETAEHAVGATFAATTSQLMSASVPNGFYVRGGDVLHFLSHNTTAVVTVSFYAIQEG